MTVTVSCGANVKASGVVCCLRFCASGPATVSSVFGQLKVTDKSNEISAIPQLLHVLELAGCIVTIDAMGCQTEIARTIIQQNADYLLAVKANQGQFYQDVQDLFAGCQEVNFQDVPHD